MQYLHEEGVPLRVHFCQDILARIQDVEEFQINILQTDPGKIQKSSDQWIRFLVNKWCGVLRKKIIESYFYEGTLTENRYFDFLTKELPELLELYITKRSVTTQNRSGTV